MDTEVTPNDVRNINEEKYNEPGVQIMSAWSVVVSEQGAL